MPPVSSFVEKPFLAKSCSPFLSSIYVHIDWQHSHSQVLYDIDKKKIKIDGEIGPISDAAIRAFQKSCKITVDGKVGVNTRKCLKAN